MFMRLTYNLPETMKEFYDLYRELLTVKGMDREAERLNIHIKSKSKTTDEVLKITEETGFYIKEVINDSFSGLLQTEQA